MHFDDRLATVLRIRAGGEAMARIQYRQLLDLLGTLPVEAKGPQVDAAFDRLGELAGAIPARVRAGMVGEPGMRLRNPRLVALLAAGEPSVAAAAIGAARLGEEEWIDLAPALPGGALALVGRRRDIGPRATALFQRIGMSPPALPAHGTAAPRLEPAEPANDTAGEAGRSDDIGAIVQRIETFRKARGTADAANADAESAPGQRRERARSRLRAFDFATDSEGCIVWSDPGMAPMALGLRLVSHDMTAPASARATLALALRHRQPVRGLILELSGAAAIAGPWQVDAAPRFDPVSGGYTGHAGRMRRLAEPAPAAAPPEADSEADRIRQLLHELRTPVNAIQGFAEVIQQQLFGPAPHEYRALAANVAGDAARVLAGLDELERLARLESGRLDMEAGDCDLAAILDAAISQLRPYTEPRSSGFALRLRDPGTLRVAMGGGDCERLVWRLLASLAGSAAPGEVLRLRAGADGPRVRLSIGLPQSLAGLDDEMLWHALATPGSKALSAGTFGTGFALRLARAEAAAAGGELRRKGKRLRMDLPGLTDADAGHSGTKGSMSHG